jgi:hypothetical protein
MLGYQKSAPGPTPFSAQWFLKKASREKQKARISGLFDLGKT